MLRTFRTEYERLLPSVEKPGRYLGNERGAVRKDLHAVAVRFALAFPDVYEIAQSHLGLQILYDILNRRADVAAERCYAPWSTWRRSCARTACRWSRSRATCRCATSTSSASACSTSSPTPTCSPCSSWAASRCAARTRAADDPLVIAGGPCAFNPEPLAPLPRRRRPRRRRGGGRADRRRGRARGIGATARRCCARWPAIAGRLRARVLRRRATTPTARSPRSTPLDPARPRGREARPARPRHASRRRRTRSSRTSASCTTAPASR